MSTNKWDEEARRVLSNFIEIDGCWIWARPLQNTGYGLITYSGKQVGAHRASYQLFKGDIPQGLEIDHLCRTRACINPDHLEAVTRLVNYRRGKTNVNKDRCKRGHEFTAENTYHRQREGRSPERDCRKCRKDAMRKHFSWNGRNWYAV